jgi:hypothetical protein
MTMEVALAEVEAEADSEAVGTTTAKLTSAMD